MRDADIPMGLLFLLIHSFCRLDALRTKNEKVHILCLMLPAPPTAAKAPESTVSAEMRDEPV